MSAQPWYNGGYRANIVAYTIAVLSEITKHRKKSLDFLRIWSEQDVNSTLETILTIISQAVNKDIIRPQQGISNISEWCKKDACWTRIQLQIDDIEERLPREFDDHLLSLEDRTSNVKGAKQA